MRHKLSCDILCAHVGEDRAALVLWFAAGWLPAETNPVYAGAIRKLRDAGRRPVQATNFVGTGSPRAVRGLFRQVLARTDELGATDILAAVSPDDAEGYCRILEFSELLPGEPDLDWSYARDRAGRELPTRLIGLRLDDVPEAKRKRL